MSISAPTRTGSRRARRVGSQSRRASFAGWLFALPALVVLTAFIFYPMAQAFYLSFFQWNLLGDPVFVGWQNYQSLMDSAPFAASVRNTLIFTVGNVVGTYVVAMGVALLVNAELRAMRFFRMMSLLPAVIPMVIAGLIWKWIFEPQYGLANTMLAIFGADRLDWLFDANLALPAVLLVTIWKDFGVYMLILLAGLQSVPQEQIEAATIDKANAWQRFRHVILPHMRPSSFFVVMLVLFNSFKIFDQVWVMTEGGPGYATTTIVTFIYSRLMSNVGLAAAAAVVLFVVIALATLPQLRWSGRADD